MVVLANDGSGPLHCLQKQNPAGGLAACPKGSRWSLLHLLHPNHRFGSRMSQRKTREIHSQPHVHLNDPYRLGSNWLVRVTWSNRAGVLRPAAEERCFHEIRDTRCEIWLPPGFYGGGMGVDNGWWGGVLSWGSRGPGCAMGACGWFGRHGLDTVCEGVCWTPPGMACGL